MTDEDKVLFVAAVLDGRLQPVTSSGSTVRWIVVQRFIVPNEEHALKVLRNWESRG